uniref:RING-type domain-containing protein n=1 Tax=Trichobilharzia regenti TaxID=157069 RepID=A0AA85K8L6_TRIRE|nr:unnamed protein product [Trichobilharzia regenti]
MFSDDLFSNFFPSNLISNSLFSDSNIIRTIESHERAFQQVHNEFKRVAREMFDTAMRPRQLYPSNYRSGSRIPAGQIVANGRDHVRVTLGGNVVNDSFAHQRMNRHINDDPVVFNRSRLQWYDSNTRRQLLPEPPTRPGPSGLITRNELEKLPVSMYRVKRHEPTNSDQAHAANSFESSPNTSTCIPVINRNQSSTPLSPGSAYLQPESKSATLFEIQPIQSSPSTGRAECEICLNEYQNKDRLRHLPCGHAFHTKCIDIWLKQSTTCPKCRAGIRTALGRLERARLRLRTQSNNGTSSTAASVRPPRPRLCASTSGAQEQNRTTTSGQSSTITSTSTTANSTNRSQMTTRNTVGPSSSDTSTSRNLRQRVKPSYSPCTTSATTNTITNTTTATTTSATSTVAATVSSTSYYTNTPANRRNQRDVSNQLPFSQPLHRIHQKLFRLKTLGVIKFS